jgi:RNA polymerase-interacting CarD/CdnL/TRCF family regulator
MSFSGRDEATYAKVHFSNSNLTFTILEDECPNILRNLISAAGARKLLKQIEDWDGKPKSQWKARADKHQAQIETGDPFEYAKVPKEISRIGPEEELRPRDRANLEQSLNLLREEITHSLKKTPAQADKLIGKALDA